MLEIKQGYGRSFYYRIKVGSVHVSMCTMIMLIAKKLTGIRVD